MVPLNKSIIAIVAVFTLYRDLGQFHVAAWLISDVDKMPLSVLLATFSKHYGVYVGPSWRAPYFKRCLSLCYS
jgi:multiple sugar transport system permease protein